MYSKGWPGATFEVTINYCFWGEDSFRSYYLHVIIASIHHPQQQVPLLPILGSIGGECTVYRRLFLWALSARRWVLINWRGDGRGVTPSYNIHLEHVKWNISSSKVTIFPYKWWNILSFQVTIFPNKIWNISSFHVSIFPFKLSRMLNISYFPQTKLFPSKRWHFAFQITHRGQYFLLSRYTNISPQNVTFLLLSITHTEAKASSSVWQFTEMQERNLLTNAMNDDDNEDNSDEPILF